MAKSKYIAVTETQRCVACGMCMNTCPRQAVTIDKGKYAKIDTELCVGCGLCIKACPAGIITKRERSAVWNARNDGTTICG